MVKAPKKTAPKAPAKKAPAKAPAKANGKPKTYIGEANPADKPLSEDEY